MVIRTGMEIKIAIDKGDEIK